MSTFVNTSSISQKITAGFCIAMAIHELLWAGAEREEEEEVCSREGMGLLSEF